MATALAPIRTRTVPIRSAVVNTVLTMATTGDLARARRFRRYLEDLWVDRGGRRHGFVVGLAAESGIKRATLSSWFSESRPKEPGLPALGQIADYFNVERVELVAAMDGVRLLTEAQAQRAVEEETARVLEAARREGLLPAGPKGSTGPSGAAQRPVGLPRRTERETVTS